MLPDYEDIRSRIDVEPVWFDDRGVPRYDEFGPGMLGVYDKYTLLAQVACQACGRRFLVGQGWTNYDLLIEGAKPRLAKFEEIAEHYLYGDPPRHDCAAGGDTMMSDTVAVVEAWEHSVGADWRRRRDLEGAH